MKQNFHQTGSTVAKIAVQNTPAIYNSNDICSSFQPLEEDKPFLTTYPEIAQKLKDNCLEMLGNQDLKIDSKTFKVLYAGGIGCVSCHAKDLYVFDKNKIYVGYDDIGGDEALTDPRVKTTKDGFTVKSNITGGGGVPSPGDLGLVEVYKYDLISNSFSKTKEYKEPYTLKDYEGE